MQVLISGFISARYTHMHLVSQRSGIAAVIEQALLRASWQEALPCLPSDTGHTPWP